MECKNSVSDAEKDAMLIAKLREDIDRLERLIALLPGNVYWLDRGNSYLGCNNIVAEISKLKATKDIVGKTNKELFGEEEAKKIDSINIRVMETGDQYNLEEVSDWENVTRTYLTQKVPWRDKHGEVIGVLGVSVDISDRKRMEKELKEARLKAEISNQAKLDLIRNMEHDIRTPLGGIFSTAGYLASIEKEPQKKELLQDLQDAAQELISYLNGIIERAHLSEGGIPIVEKAFNLERIVKSIYALELPAAKNKGLLLDLIFDEKIPKQIIGDSFRVYRVLLNLASNAIKFTQKGYVKIIVQLIEQSAEQATIELSMEDSGIGIAEQDIENIYEKFSCGTNDMSKTNIGTGLGLWIVKQFTQELGGSITLKTEVNKGSLFTCVLPFKLS